MRSPIAAIFAVLPLVACASAGGGVGSAAPASVSAPALSVQAPSGPLSDDGLLLYSAGIDALLVDEKDRGLRDALHLLDERLVELPAEIGQELPIDALTLPVRALLGPLSLRLSYHGMQVAQQGRAPVHAQLECTLSSPAEARDFARRMMGLLPPDMPPGELAANGLQRVPINGPFVLHHGALGDRFVVAVGDVLSEPPQLANIGLPQGVAPAFAFRMDFEQYMTAIEDFAAMAMGGEGAQLMELMSYFALEDFEIEVAQGAGPDRTYTVTRIPGYVSFMESTSGLPTARIGAESLRLVPRDAVFASLGVTDHMGSLRMMLDILAANPQISEQLGGQNPLDMLYEITGVHLANDLLAHLGQRWGIYGADSTGGGGVSSIVLFGEVANPDGLADGLANLALAVNGMSANFAKGYVELRTVKHGGHELTTLAFPGLPVPFEPTWALHDGWLFTGLMPQAVLGALEQQGRGESLLDDPAFRANATGAAEDLVSVTWLDSPELLADGYGWVNLACTALQNGVRSRSDAARAAAPILPSFAELARGARPSLTFGRIIGADLVAYGQSDRSALVNGTAIAGLLDRAAFIGALPMLAIVGLAQQRAELAQMQAMEAYQYEYMEEGEEELMGLGYVDGEWVEIEAEGEAEMEGMEETEELGVEPESPEEAQTGYAGEDDPR